MLEKNCHSGQNVSYKPFLIVTTDNFDNKYFNMLSQGNLTLQSHFLAGFVSNGFAILDSVDHKIITFKSISIQIAAEYVLKKYPQPVCFTCEDHVE